MLSVIVALPFAFDLGRSVVNGTDWLAARAYGGNARVWRAYAPVGRQLLALARPGDRLYVGEDEAGHWERAAPLWQSYVGMKRYWTKRAETA